MQPYAYLRNKSWSEITREDRYFCAELYFDIKDNPKSFVEFLNKKLEKGFNINQQWEVGYEVCFYRDYLFSIGEPVKLKYNKQKYPQKRTFDLCLFSDTDIIIIEAKADQNFSKSQMKSVKKDKNLLTRLLKENGKAPSINIFLLCASTNKQEIKGYKKFYWKDLVSIYNNSIYAVADNLPSRKRIKKKGSE
jgi:hypothetical protein